jgi:methionyl aminopeptidase
LTLIPEQYRKAGKVTDEVRALLKTRMRPGMGYLETCLLVEKEIAARGASPAFPTGIGVGHVTAHYSPQEDDTSVFKETDLVKVDFGVHVEGYIADTAVTVTFNSEHRLLLEATEKALGAAIEAAKKEQRTGEIGREIQREASRWGFRTIENLTGHTLDRYVVHAGKSIPNLYVPGTQSLKKGDVFAIEPFVTQRSAAGYVVDSPSETIFSLVARKKTGDVELDRFAETVWDDRKTLPFTPRWYSLEFGRGRVGDILRQLMKKRIMRSYPTLVEASGSPVAQFEHTMGLDEDGLVVLT